MGRKGKGGVKKNQVVEGGEEGKSKEGVWEEEGSGDK